MDGTGHQKVLSHRSQLVSGPTFQPPHAKSELEKTLTPAPPLMLSIGVTDDHDEPSKRSTVAKNVEPELSWPPQAYKNPSYTATAGDTRGVDMEGALDHEIPSNNVCVCVSVCVCLCVCACACVYVCVCVPQPRHTPPQTPK